MLRRYWNHGRKPKTSYPTATASAGTWIHWVDLKKNVWSKLRWIQSTGIKGVKDVLFEDAAPIKTHECCTSSRTHGHGSKIITIITSCLFPANPWIWVWLRLFENGAYPDMAICVLENWWLSIIRCFLEGVPVFQTNPYAVTKKRKYLESYTNPQKILVECMGQNMFGIRFEVRIS